MGNGQKLLSIIALDFSTEQQTNRSETLFCIQIQSLRQKAAVPSFEIAIAVVDAGAARQFTVCTSS